MRGIAIAHSTPGIALLPANK